VWAKASEMAPGRNKKSKPQTGKRTWLNDPAVKDAVAATRLEGRGGRTAMMESTVVVNPPRPGAWQIGPGEQGKPRSKGKCHANGNDGRVSRARRGVGALRIAAGGRSKPSIIVLTPTSRSGACAQQIGAQTNTGS